MCLPRTVVDRFVDKDMKTNLTTQFASCMVSRSGLGQNWEPLVRHRSGVSNSWQKNTANSGV